MKLLENQNIHALTNLYVSNSSKKFESVEEFYSFYDSVYEEIKELNKKLSKKSDITVFNKHELGL